MLNTGQFLLSCNSFRSYIYSEEERFSVTAAAKIENCCSLWIKLRGKDTLYERRCVALLIITTTNNRKRSCTFNNQTIHSSVGMKDTRVLWRLFFYHSLCYRLITKCIKVDWMIWNKDIYLWNRVRYYFLRPDLWPAYIMTTPAAININANIRYWPANITGLSSKYKNYQTKHWYDYSYYVSKYFNYCTHLFWLLLVS